ILASPQVGPVRPLGRVRERSRRHQGDRAGGGGRATGLEPRAPGLHRPRRPARRERTRRRARAPGAPARACARGRRARAAAAGRVEPRRLDLRAGLARGPGRRPVPARAADAHGPRAADGRGAGAGLDRARLARRTDPRRTRGRMGRAAQCAPAAGGRRPPPRRARARLRGRLRGAAAVARRLTRMTSPDTRFFTSCGKGLEYLLADELQALGCARATAAVAGANAEGSLPDAQRAVLWSRLASRVLWPLATFDCPDQDALYAGAAAIDWPAHLDAGTTIAVDAHVSGSAVTHARYAAQRVKDAVVDVMRERTGARPDVDVEAPGLRLNLVVRKGRAIVSVDLGGGPLHRRGWRIAQGEAPLKETVAAAVLLRGRWAEAYREGGALLDPMCGSGTLLVEGALMAADVAPGLLRHGDAPPTRWTGFDADGWRALVAEAREREAAGRAALRAAFSGRDLDPHAIAAARRNAERAGVAGSTDLQVADVRALEPQAAARGVVVCNPPYDVRLAADPALYRALGDALRRATPGWRASLLCGDAELARATGLRANKRYQVFNGAIECTLLVADPVAPPQRERTAAPVLSEGATMVANRLRRNLRTLKAWREREGVT